MHTIIISPVDGLLLLRSRLKDGVTPVVIIDIHRHCYYNFDVGLKLARFVLQNEHDVMHLMQ